jgi:hypothetical protein
LNEFIEIKRRTTEQNKVKCQAAKEWIIAVNASGSFGAWEFKVLNDPKELFELVK